MIIYYIFFISLILFDIQKYKSRFMFYVPCYVYICIFCFLYGMYISISCYLVLLYTYIVMGYIFMYIRQASLIMRKTFKVETICIQYICTSTINVLFYKGRSANGFSVLQLKGKQQTYKNIHDVFIVFTGYKNQKKHNRFTKYQCTSDLYNLNIISCYWQRVI